MTLDGQFLGGAAVVQHVIGLVGGAIAYALMLRLGVRRSLAVVGAAVILLDGYAIALEQFILAESLFALLLLGGFYLAVGKDRGHIALVASGLLLAVAISVRTAGLFAVPVWGTYLVWTHRSVRRLVAPALAVVVPLLLYSSLYGVKTGHFGVSVADGWFLYGRVAEIADCEEVSMPKEARSLCEPDPGSDHRGAGFYVWSANSPAVRRFGYIRGPNSVRQAESNRVLGTFARTVIAERPGRYAGLVGRDYLRYFTPGEMSAGTSDRGLYLSERFDGRGTRRKNVGKPPAQGTLGAALLRYERAIHTPRWLLGPLALLAIFALVLSIVARRRYCLSHRREILLLAGTPLLVLLASTATTDFIVRYLVPMVPFLVCGGAVALSDLLDVRRRTGTGPAPSPPATAAAGR